MHASRFGIPGFLAQGWWHILLYGGGPKDSTQMDAQAHIRTHPLVDMEATEGVMPLVWGNIRSGGER